MIINLKLIKNITSYRYLEMMLFGLAEELNYMDYNTAIILGFIPFVYYFKLIYDKYLITNTDSSKTKLY